MIYLGGCGFGCFRNVIFPHDQRAAAGRAPVGYCLLGQNGMAVSADPFHIHRLIDEAVLQQRLQHSRYTVDMHPPVRLVAIDMDGTLLPTLSQQVSARNARALRDAQKAGIVVAIATGRRSAYTIPLLEGLGLRADTPLITSNGAVTRTLGGELGSESIDRCHLPSRIARGLCGLLRPFGSIVFTFDRPGRGELALEDLEQAHGRIALWVEANRDAIEVIKPLEDALADGDDPIQGMVAGGIERMRAAEDALKASGWADACEAVRTEYPARDLSILDLLPRGVHKGWALERLAARLSVDRRETMAIGDNWNDVGMFEWAGQPVVMANAALELRTMAKTNGWKQAPSNDHDGVAMVLEAAIRKLFGEPAVVAG
jgi:Cof subfamily protein (haloacid dehalogenase superfamily)